MVIEQMNDLEAIKAGIFGVVVGDALGVPVEFTSRAERKADPVTNMREYGTHSQPRGTWSDDSSMALASLDSIIQNGGINFDDMMGKFRDWKINGNYTPHTIYDSDIYEKLMDAETGLYRESPSYVFGLLQDEINFGHIVQAEV